MAKKRRRLNVKLLITLAVALAVVALGGVLVGQYYLDSPDRAVSRAELFETQAQEALDAGDLPAARSAIERAAGLWNKAFRLTNDSQYQVKAIEATERLTTDPVKGDTFAQQVQGSLRQLASNPNNIDAVRKAMRYTADSPALLSPSLPQFARDVRDRAQLILSREPDDAEARLLEAVATLHLAQIPGGLALTREEANRLGGAGTGANVSATQRLADEARQTLHEVVATDPLDGLGLAALQRDFGRRFQQQINEAVAAERRINGDSRAALQEIADISDTFRTVLDAAGEAAQDHTPRDGRPADTGLLLARLAAAYDVLARSRTQASDLSTRIAQIGDPTLTQARQVLLDPDSPAEARESARQLLTGIEADRLAASQAAAQDALEAARRHYLQAADLFLNDAGDALDPAGGEAILLGTDVLTALNLASEFHTRRGDPDLGIALMQALVNSRPWDTRARNLLVDRLSAAGQLQEAADVAKAGYDLRDAELPLIRGEAGATARRLRLIAGLTLSDALLQLRDSVLADRTLDRSARSQEARQLLEEARGALDTFETARRNAGVERDLQSRRVEAQLRLAEGEIVEAQNALDGLDAELAARERGAGMSGMSEERGRVVGLLADAYRLRNQPGAELEALRSLRDGGRITGTDALRLATLLVAQSGRQEAGSEAAIRLTDEARRLLQSLQRLRPDNAVVTTLLAQLDAAGTDEADGTPLADLPEGTDRERRVKVTVALQQGDREESIRLLRRLVADNPGEVNLALALARTLIDGGGEAEQAEVEQLAGRFPDDPRARRLLAFVEGGVDAQIDAIDDPIQRQIARAGLAGTQGDVEAARTGYREALAELGESTDSGDLADLSGAQRLLGIRAAEGLYSLGLNSTDFELLDEATQALISLDGDGLDGRTYAIQSRLVEGEALLRGSIEPDDDESPESARQRGQTIVNESVQDAIRLAEQNPRTTSVLLVQGEALMKVGRLEEAMASFRRAEELSPNDVRALVGQVNALFSAAEPDPVAISTLIDRATGINPNSSALARVASRYQLEYGDPSSVIDRLEQQIARQPDAAEPRRQLLETLLRITLRRPALVAAGESTPEELQAFADQTARVGLDFVDAFPDDTSVWARIVAVAPFVGEAMSREIDGRLTKLMTPSDPDSKEQSTQVAFAAADFYESLDRQAQAEAVLRRHLSALSRTDDRGRQANAVMRLSVLLARQDKLAQAISVLDDHDDLPTVRDAKVSLLAGAAIAGSLDGAVDQIRDALDDAAEVGRPGVRSLLAAATAFVRLGEAEQAIEPLANVREQIADDDTVDPAVRTQTLYLSGMAWANREESARDFDRAREFLEAALDEQEGFVQAREALAGVILQQAIAEEDPQFSRELEDESIEQYRRILALQPARHEIRQIVIRDLLNRVPPDYVAAENEFRRAVRQAGERPDRGLAVLQLLRARMERTRGNTQTARRHLDSVLDIAGRVAFEEARAALPEADLTPEDFDLSDPSATALSQRTAGSWIDAVLGEKLALGDADDVAELTALYFTRLTNAPSGAPGVSADRQIPLWLGRRRGAALARLDQDAAGLEAYRRLIGSTPPQFQAQLLVEMADLFGFEPTYDLIRASVEAEDADVQTLRQAAILHAQTGRADEGLALLERARQGLADAGLLEVGENAARLDLQAATLRLQADPPRLDEAVTGFRQVLDAVESDGLRLSASNNLAYALTLVADDLTSEDQAVAALEEAQVLSQTALDLARQFARLRQTEIDVNILDTHAWVQARLAMLTGDDEALVDALRRLRSLRVRTEANPSQAFAALYYHLAAIHAYRGDERSAREAIRTGLEMIDRLDAEQGVPQEADIRQKLEALRDGPLAAS
jgi:tetratricopeptide (TPR) repeat protein